MDESLRYRRLKQWANTCRVRRIRYFGYTLMESFLRFRLRKDFLITLAAILRNDLEHQTRWGFPVTSMQQVFLTLCFYATAGFRQVIGDLFEMSHYAVCKVKHRVLRAISKHKRQFISFPVDFHETKRSFYDVEGFPCDFGAIDWTHARIVFPDRNNAVAFIDWQKFYSVNVEAVCDSKALITSVVELVFQWIHWCWNNVSDHLTKGIWWSRGFTTTFRLTFLCCSSNSFFVYGFIRFQHLWIAFISRMFPSGFPALKLCTTFSHADRFLLKHIVISFVFQSRILLPELSK